MKDKQYIALRVEGPRAVVFERVLVRVAPDYAKDFHLDTDEANAAGIKNGDYAILAVAIN